VGVGAETIDDLMTSKEEETSKSKGYKAQGRQKRMGCVLQVTMGWIPAELFKRGMP